MNITTLEVLYFFLGALMLFVVMGAIREILEALLRPFIICAQVNASLQASQRARDIARAQAQAALLTGKRGE
jgi:hypothetical protein